MEKRARSLALSPRLYKSGVSASTKRAAVRSRQRGDYPQFLWI